MQDVPKKNILPFKLNILRHPRGSEAKLLIVFYRILEIFVKKVPARTTRV